MSTTIDDLRIDIQADSKEANGSLEKLVSTLSDLAKALGLIDKSNGIENVANSGSKAVNATNNVAKATENMSKSFQKAKVSVQALMDKYKDLGKGYDFNGSTEKGNALIEKYSLALENAKLKKEELELAGKDEGTMYEYAIRDIQKYSNMIDVIKSKISGGEDIGTAIFSEELQKKFDSGYFNNAIKSVEEMEEELEEFEYGVEELDQKIVQTFASIGESAENAFTNSTNKIYTFRDFIENFKDRLAEQRGRKQNAMLEAGEIAPTEEFAELQAEIDKTTEKIKKLQGQMERGLATNGRFSETTTFKKIQYDIDQATTKVGELIRMQDDLEASGGAYEKVTRQLPGNFQRASKATTPLEFSMKNLTKVSDKIANSFLRITKMLRLMVIRSALRSIITETKEGFQNLAQYSTEFNATMSMLYSDLQSLKNGFAVAFAPVINIVAPVFDYLLNGLFEVSNAMSHFWATLLGKDTWTKANKVTLDYAESLNKAGGKAKQLNKQLQAFDELNNLTSSSGSGSGGSKNDIAISDMFSTENVTGQFNNLAETFKRLVADPIKTFWGQIMSGDFFGAGNTLSTFVSNLFDFFSSAIGRVDWNGVGYSIGSFFAGIDWKKVLISAGNLVLSIIDAGVELWKGAFDANPIATTIVTGLLLWKWAGVGSSILGLIFGSTAMQQATTLGTNIGSTFGTSLQIKAVAIAGIAGFAIGEALCKKLYPWVDEASYKISNIFDAVFNVDWDTRIQALKDTFHTLFTGEEIERELVKGTGPNRVGNFPKPNPRRAYAGGGYPTRADIFYANENGVPELIGTKGTRTAVANGTEVTGIADAVYNSGDRQASLLTSAVNLLQVIANKEFGITDSAIANSVKRSDRDVYNRTGRHMFA